MNGFAIAACGVAAHGAETGAALLLSTHSYAHFSANYFEAAVLLG
jgi:hypothetical protein